jgi:hypothetical protein
VRLKTFFCLVTVFFCFQKADAQTDNSIGNWNVFVFKGKFAGKYFYNAEFNFRKYPFKPIYDYSEYKILFGRTLNKNWSVDMGTGGYNSSLTGDFLHTPSSRKEIRTWVDFLLRYSWAHLNFDNRVRIEHRFNIWSGAPNRFRYRPQFTIPVNHAKLSNNTFYLLTSNDAFFGTGEHRLELNMFFLGGGYRFNDRFTVNAGNMNNYDFRKTSDNSRNYLYLTFTFDLTKKTKTQIEVPSTIISNK